MSRQGARDNRLAVCSAEWYIVARLRRACDETVTWIDPFPDCTWIGGAGSASYNDTCSGRVWRTWLLSGTCH
jgi:hypothetical protein